MDHDQTGEDGGRGEGHGEEAMAPEDVSPHVDDVREVQEQEGGQGTHSRNPGQASDQQGREHGPSEAPASRKSHAYSKPRSTWSLVELTFT